MWRSGSPQKIERGDRLVGEEGEGEEWEAVDRKRGRSGLQARLP